MKLVEFSRRAHLVRWIVCCPCIKGRIVLCLPLNQNLLSACSGFVTAHEGFTVVTTRAMAHTTPLSFGERFRTLALASFLETASPETESRNEKQVVRVRICVLIAAAGRHPRPPIPVAPGQNAGFRRVGSRRAERTSVGNHGRHILPDPLLWRIFYPVSTMIRNRVSNWEIFHRPAV